MQHWATRSTATHTPVPTFTSTPSPNQVKNIQRITYNISGQMVGVHVVQFDDGGVKLADDLYYLYADHLGSVAAISDDQGTRVEDIIRHKPFGNYWSPPSSSAAEITDKEHTGHKTVPEHGLIDMNARWYDSYIPCLLSFVASNSVQFIQNLLLSCPQPILPQHI